MSLFHNWNFKNIQIIKRILYKNFYISYEFFHNNHIIQLQSNKYESILSEHLKTKYLNLAMNFI